MPDELSDGGEVGAGVEEIPCVGAARVVGADGGQAGSVGAAGDLANGSTVEPMPVAEIAGAVDGMEQRPGVWPKVVTAAATTVAAFAALVNTLRPR